ncbi:MAG: EF-hand domain-containing protein [Arcobacteraceae bacterium]|nr:EF-hand domain-containing protein [Arcobacteraceae bacterium]
MKNLVKKVNLSLVVVGALSMVSSSLVAQNIPDRGPISFSVYDSNNDNFVSQSEFYDARARRMSKKAAQGKAMRKAGNAPEFEVFDANSDGRITKMELLEGQNAQMQKNRANRGSKKQGKMNNRQGNKQGMRRNMPTFESYDLNGDGYLTSNEMNEARAQRMQQQASQGKMMRNSGNQTKFSDIDRNNDGRVNKQEFIANQMRKR